MNKKELMRNFLEEQLLSARLAVLEREWEDAPPDLRFDILSRLEPEDFEVDPESVADFATTLSLLEDLSKNRKQIISPYRFS